MSKKIKIVIIIVVVALLISLLACFAAKKINYACSGIKKYGTNLKKNLDDFQLWADKGLEFYNTYASSNENLNSLTVSISSGEWYIFKNDIILQADKVSATSEEIEAHENIARPFANYRKCNFVCMMIYDGFVVFIFEGAYSAIYSINGDLPEKSMFEGNYWFDKDEISYYRMSRNWIHCRRL